MLNDYIINEETQAIIPYGDNQSRVIEEKKEVLVNKSPKRIINFNCKYNGSNFNNRVSITGKLTGDSYKLPVLLDNRGTIILFPTESPRLKTCCWINYKNIKTFYKSKNGNTILKFFEGQTIELKTSLNILKNQILKSNFLNYKIHNI